VPIIGLQRRMRELGRIRTGNQVAGANGKRRPSKLDTFRLTSDSKELIEAAQALWGGTVTPWDNNGSREWEVITTTDSLDIMVPPGQPVTQWMELWSGGGCLRRCDTVTEFVEDAPCGTRETTLPNEKVIPPCPLDPADRREASKRGEACKETTRLNVILPALPDLGVWRLESHGYYAAVELAGAGDILAMATQMGMPIKARLRLEQREKKQPGQPTQKYAVPIIEFTETRMIDLLGPGPEAAPQIAAPRPATPALPAASLPRGDDFHPPAPAPSPPVAPDADPPASITREEFFAELEKRGIDLDYATEKAREAYPDRGPGVPLNGEQLAALLATLVKEAAQAAI
jgi:hypothetical protein